MDPQLLCLVVVAVCSAQGAMSSSDSARVAARVSGVCPSEEQQAQIRQQITNDTLAALTLGLTEDNPASSCNAIPVGRPSGYYWILPAIGPPAVQVYCDFNRQCGCDGPSTWTRVAFLNMSDPNQDCPSSNWTLYSSPVRACGRGFDGGCNSVTFSTHGQFYNRVCGRAIGYQYHDTSAFWGITTLSRSIDQAYLTHGSTGSRQHIWSFVSALGDAEELVGRDRYTSWICPCSSEGDWPYNTSFVGNDYFCDSGNHGSERRDKLYSSDPLWDGAGCGSTSTCCQFKNPPWFCKTLPQHTTDDLEVRVCKTATSNRDAPVQLVEVYVQ